MMKCIAIDDEPIALQIIQSHAVKVPFIELQRCFTNGIEAMEYLQHETIDLIFLDINMPDISGIELFHSLRRKPLNRRSSHGRYAQEREEESRRPTSDLRVTPSEPSLRAAPRVQVRNVPSRVTKGRTSSRWLAQGDYAAAFFLRTAWLWVSCISQ